MSLRHFLTRLFRRRPITAAQQAAADIERRQRVRQQHPIANACRVNGLNRRERAQVFRHFEDVAAQVGMAEARTAAVNLAARLSHRRPRDTRNPWTPPTAA